jgi:ketosteroid isomerase-like protein
MSDTSDAVSVVAAFGAAWGSHDLDTALSMTTDDCLFESTGPAPDGVQHKGRDAVRQAWQAIFDDTQSKFEVEESFALGDRVVERWCYTWNGGHIRGVDLFRVRDGKVCEKLAYVKG